MKILGIESSCDDTSAAIVDESRKVLAVKSANQDKDHAPFGGIVPEIASRNHTHFMLPLIDEVFKESKTSWDEISAIAVTSRPGLMGSLLVGVVTAKTLALTKNKPLIGVHHLEGHIMAPFLRDAEYEPPDFYKEPFLALVVSGGHSAIYKVKEQGKYETLGCTIDDAAGEAFDKFAKLIGLGYPGGYLVDKNSINGDCKKFKFPVSKLKGYDLSYSGIKASAMRMFKSMTKDEIEKEKSNLCASYQEAVVDQMLNKLKKAAEDENIKKIILTGGVSANSRLREKTQQWVNSIKGELLLPPIKYCTDNAAMIALAGLYQFKKNNIDDLDLKPHARASLDQGEL